MGTMRQVFLSFTSIPDIIALDHTLRTTSNSYLSLARNVRVARSYVKPDSLENMEKFLSRTAYFIEEKPSRIVIQSSRIRDTS